MVLGAKCNQVMSGLAIYLLGYGLSAFYGRNLVGEKAPTFSDFEFHRTGWLGVFASPSMRRTADDSGFGLQCFPYLLDMIPYVASLAVMAFFANSKRDVMPRELKNVFSEDKGCLG